MILHQSERTHLGPERKISKNGDYFVYNGSATYRAAYHDVHTLLSVLIDLVEDGKKLSS